MVKKWKDFPKELEAYTNASLSDTEFADDVNRVYPINDGEAIAQSFVVLRDNPYKDYSKAETIYLLDRLCRAAEKFEVDLDDFVSESLGGEVMIDKNSSEFREAVEAEVKVQLADLADQDKTSKALQALNDQVKASDAKVEELQKALETIKAEKEDIQKVFDEYKSDVETKAKIRERIDALKSVGLEKEDWTETEEAVAEMSEKVFNLYREEISKAVKKTDPKMIIDEEEDATDPKKKDKKGPGCKASTDIVKESKSEGPLPNGEVIEEEDQFPNLTKAFARMRKN